MSPINWWSQPFPPEGGVTGSGVMRQLGTPSMELLDVLVRESAQNSWDASINGRIRYSIEFRKLGAHAKAWHDLVGDSDPTNGTVVDPSSLNSESLLLIVSDRDTSGLGGPLLADEKLKPGEVANFVQFLRNVGEPRDKDLGGGTYGFGKAIFYNLSECGAIMVDTNCTDERNPRRLMGAALGGPFTGTDGVRYTGRHWWGNPEPQSGVPLPLLDDDAARTSRQLGLPGFDDGSTGTDVAVLLPSLHFSDEEAEAGGDHVENALERVVSAILWHLWPKLGSAKRAPEISVRVTSEGEEIPMQRPDQYPFLRPFTQALDAIEAGDGTHITRSRIKYPGPVGDWAVHVCQPDPTAGSSAGLLSAKPFSGPYHHVARMRQAKLVVDYLECEPFPGQEFGYAGAFLASKKFDQCFADAEPPTHDKWETRGLPDEPRLVVNYGTTKLKEGIRNFLASKQSTRSSDLAGLGRLSAKLAPLIPFDTRSVGSSSESSSGTRTSKKPGKPRKSARARVLEQPRLTRDTGAVRLLAQVTPPEVGHRAVSIIATPSVILDDGRKELDPPVNAPVPEVTGWFDPAGNLLSRDSELQVTKEIGAHEYLTLELTRIPNASVGLSISTVEE